MRTSFEDQLRDCGRVTELLWKFISLQIGWGYGGRTTNRAGSEVKRWALKSSGRRMGRPARSA